MSDESPTKLDSFLQWKLGIERPSLAYAAKCMARTTLFAVRVPYPLLKAWNSILTQDVTISFGDVAECKENYPFTHLLEYSVPGNSFAINSDPGVRSRINKGLATLASRVCGEYSNLKGRKRQNLDSKTKLFHIYTGETVSVADLKKENKNVRDDLKKWKKTCESLESDICELYEEIKSVINEKDEQISNLQSINKELKVHTGKHVSEVKKKSRTLKTFMSRAQRALWFSKSFGLNIESIIVSETETGFVKSSCGVPHNCHGFDALSDQNKSKVEMVLFLMDKLCVGDNFYHELTMICDDLPKSYLIKQRRNQLNNLCHITSTPGEEEGAQVSFKDLLRERIAEHVTTHPSIITNNKPVQVKI